MRRGARSSKVRTGGGSRGSRGSKATCRTRVQVERTAAVGRGPGGWGVQGANAQAQYRGGPAAWYGYTVCVNTLAAKLPIRILLNQYWRLHAWRSLGLLYGPVMATRNR